jgi:hypothetical protein
MLKKHKKPPTWKLTKPQIVIFQCKINSSNGRAAFSFTEWNTRMENHFFIGANCTEKMDISFSLHKLLLLFSYCIQKEFFIIIQKSIKNYERNYNFQHACLHFISILCCFLWSANYESYADKASAMLSFFSRI